MTVLSRSGVRTACVAALSEALALLLPVACAGCDEPDIALCEQCRAALAPAPRRRLLDAPGGPVEVWSGLRFEGVAARVVRAIKEEGSIGLVRALTPAAAAALARAAPARDVVVVPMPTSRAAYRRRGFRVPELVIRRCGVSPERLLAHTRRTRDQRGLDRDERRANVAGSMVARGVRGRRIVVLDDVLTTGATVAEAVRALRAAGADVVAAVTVADTPRRLARAGEPLDDAFETHR